MGLFRAGIRPERHLIKAQLAHAERLAASETPVVNRSDRSASNGTSLPLTLLFATAGTIQHSVSSL